MATGKEVSAGGGGLGAIVEIANLLGGNQTTQRNSANTAPLQALLQQLQGQDYSQLISSLFSQATGQMPGLQARYSNAIGARSGSNSAVQTALDKLLQDTVLKGQQQVANQQLQNQQIQANIGGNIANATRATQQQSGANLGRAAGGLGLLQAGSKLMDSNVGKKIGDILGFGTGATDAASTLTSNAADGFSMLNTMPTSFGDYFSGGDFSAGGGFLADSVSGLGDWGTTFSDLGSTLGDFGSSIVDTGSDWLADAGNWVSDLFGFVDGGLVGRDNKPGFADGGVVQRAGGARRSAAPSFNPLQPVQNLAIQAPGQQLNPSFASGMGAIDPRRLGFEVDRSGGSSGDNGAVGDGLGGGIADGSTSIGGMLGIAAATAANPMMGLAMAIDAAIAQQNQTPTNQATPVTFSTLLGLITANPISIGKSLMNAISAASSSSNASANSDGSGNGAATGSTGPTGSVSVGVVGDDGSIGTVGTVGADGSVSTNADGGTGNSGGTSVGSDAGDSGVGSGDGNGNSGDSGASSPYKSGGPVKGPGTGTSDSIDAKLSNGEYVIPADVVKALGVSFFDNLRSQFHTPVGAK